MICFTRRFTKLAKPRPTLEGVIYSKLNTNKQEDKKSNDNHRQTHFGEEKTNQTELSVADKLGPKEDGSRMRDCTARQKHDEQNKRQWHIAQTGEGGWNTNH
eukprot:1221027-Heterocapsa_arctica.AAC.1